MIQLVQSSTQPKFLMALGFPCHLCPSRLSMSASIWLWNMYLYQVLWGCKHLKSIPARSCQNAPHNRSISRIVKCHRNSTIVDFNFRPAVHVSLHARSLKTRTFSPFTLDMFGFSTPGEAEWTGSGMTMVSHPSNTIEIPFKHPFFYSLYTLGNIQELSDVGLWAHWHGGGQCLLVRWRYCSSRGYGYDCACSKLQGGDVLRRMFY